MLLVLFRAVAGYLDLLPVIFNTKSKKRSLKILIFQLLTCFVVLLPTNMDDWSYV